MDRLVRMFKGKGKAPDIITVKRQAPELLSRVHLLVDGTFPTHYAYHLNPLLPALYLLVFEDEELSPGLKETGVTCTLAHSPSSNEVARITFQSDVQNTSTENVMWIDVYDSLIAMHIRLLPNSIFADWSMNVHGPITEHSTSSTVGDDSSGLCIQQ